MCIHKLVEPPQEEITAANTLGMLSTSPCMTASGISIHPAWRRQVNSFTDFGQLSHP